LRTFRRCSGDAGPTDSTELHRKALPNNKALFGWYFHGVLPLKLMESQEEKPVIYTMENKPIVTCAGDQGLFKSLYTSLAQQLPREPMEWRRDFSLMVWEGQLVGGLFL
ncbi:hypothetical protein XENOCAPTIV_010739, partial [Xenoophorus captivus]